MSKPNRSKMHQGAKPELFGFARESRKEPTKAEALLWEENKNEKIRWH